MSCVLRISGTDLSLKDLLRIKLIPDSTWEIGAPKIPGKPALKRYTNTGASYLVSDADFDDFDLQKSDAIEFLRKNEAQIKEAMKLPAVGEATLDFGINRREVAAQFDYFQPELLELVGKLGLGIELSQYSIDQESK